MLPAAAKPHNAQSESRIDGNPHEPRILKGRHEGGCALRRNGVFLPFSGIRVVKTVFPCVSKQCPADGVWRIGRGVSPDRVRKTRFTPSESSAGHGLHPQRAPKRCPANGVRKRCFCPLPNVGGFDEKRRK